MKSEIRKAATGALFSSDRKHRYLLWRTWSDLDNLMLFIGLNPSVADEKSDDPTIRRIIGFAKREGADGVIVANLFSLCATHPSVLKASGKPVLRDNDRWLLAAQTVTSTTVACWGGHGAHLSRSAEVLPRLGRVSGFGRTRNGEPKHPLYLRADVALHTMT